MKASSAPLADPAVVPQSTATGIRAGAGSLVACGLVATLMGLINSQWGGVPEAAVGRCALLGGGIVVLAPLGYYLSSRGRSPESVALAALLSLGIVLGGVYLFQISSLVRFPADILLWSESEFVGDLIKLTQGHPLYSAPANLESFNYPPITQTLSYLLSLPFTGGAISIPVLRAVQVCFTLATALVATLCCREVLLLAGRKERPGSLWTAFWTVGLFLAASNNITDPFVHFLHNDALGQLTSTLAFWMLLRYERSGTAWLLLPMALIPAAGFLVKQSLAIWGPLLAGYLLLFSTRCSRRVAFVFGAAAAAVLLGVMLGGRLFWGSDWTYWIFTMLGHHPISPLRSLQHLLEAWVYFAGLLLALLWFQKSGSSRNFIGLWLVAVALLATETYTSGVAWMLNHMGPGSLLAAIWFFAGLSVAWPEEDPSHRPVGARWVRAGSLAAIGALAAQGMGAVRVPVAALPEDAERYRRAIEQEFAGIRSEMVLIDMGSWMYTRDGVIVGDRAAPAGEGGFTGTADFSGILKRIRAHHYSKILVRQLHERGFSYDNYMWEKPSGVRAALLEAYQEVRSIPAVDGGKISPPWFATISVLVPRTAESDTSATP